MVQQAETTMAKCSLTSCMRAHFPIDLHAKPGQQHTQPIPTSKGSRVYVCLGVTCHLHFWQNSLGVLRATAVTLGCNGHRIRVSTQSSLWRRKLSRHSCRDSNSQLFDHESGALTNKLSQLPIHSVTLSKKQNKKILGNIKKQTINTFSGSLCRNKQ